jgi:diguanylate cyclase
VDAAVLVGMSEQTSDENARKSRWWQWFSGSAEADADEPGIEPQTPRELTAREVWLPAKRRMISKIADFLIDHDLEVIPTTLTVAYECVTGGAPRLAQLILERTEKGPPDHTQLDRGAARRKHERKEWRSVGRAHGQAGGQPRRVQQDHQRRAQCDERVQQRAQAACR